VTKIVLHHIIDSQGDKLGEEYYDADEIGITGTRNPTGLPDPITMVQYLAWVSANKAKHAQLGLLDDSKIHGDPVIVTKYQRLLSAVGSLPVNHPLKLAGLT
jgi:hypothetical protein